MSYELRLDEGVAAQVRQWVLNQFDDPSEQHAALDAIDDAFQAIAADPSGVGNTAPGPFTGLVSVRKIEVGGVGYYLRVAYRYSQDERAIVILGVKTQLF